MKLFAFISFIFLLSTASLAQTNIVVTSANDPVNPFDTQPGELRWAIEKANTTPGLDNITFNIVGGATIIQLNSSLPPITDPVIIDGQGGIKIKGLQSIYQLFQILENGSGTKLQNLEIYDAEGILIVVNNSSNNTVTNCILHSCRDFGFVFIGNSDNNIIRNNILGTTAALVSDHTLGFLGGHRLTYNPFTLQNPDNNKFGGLLPGEKNHFYNMPQATGPLDIQRGVSNLVSGNIFINNAKNIDIYTNVGCHGNICKQPPVYEATVSGGKMTVVGTSLPGDKVEVFLTNSGGIDALKLIGVATTNSSGNFSLSASTYQVGDRVIATATDSRNNTSEFGPAKTSTQGEPPPECCPESFISYTTLNGLSGIVSSGTPLVLCPDEVTFLFEGCNCGSNEALDLTWNLVNTATGSSIEDDECSFVLNGADYATYELTITIASHAEDCDPQIIKQSIEIAPCEPPPPPPCDCIGSFAPEPGKEYLISSWVKEDNAPATQTQYDKPFVELNFLDKYGVITPAGPFTANGQIIDGWQRVESKFLVPQDAVEMRILLKCQEGDCFFDDIRVYPFDGSMKTYVFDPKTLRLMAELDERNYATFYEYDEEGKLMRIKKETEKGVMTIQESKSSVIKR